MEIKTINQLRYTTYSISEDGKKIRTYEYRDVPAHVHKPIIRKPSKAHVSSPQNKDISKKTVEGVYQSKVGEAAIAEYRKIKKEIDLLTKKKITLPNGYTKTIKIKMKFRAKPSMVLTADERNTRMEEHKNRITKSAMKQINKPATKEDKFKASMLSKPLTTNARKSKPAEDTAKLTKTDTVLQKTETVAERKERQREYWLNHTKAIYKVSKLKKSTIADEPKEKVVAKKVPKTLNLTPVYHKTKTSGYHSTLAEKLRDHGQNVTSDYRVIILRKSDTTPNGTNEFKSIPFNGTQIDARNKGIVCLRESERTIKDVVGVRVVSKNINAEKALNVYFHSHNNFKKAA